MPTRLTMFGLVVPERLMQRRRVLLVSGAFIAVLAGLEWLYAFDVSLGVFYVLPVAIAATVLTNLQVVAMAVVCAFVRDQFHPPMGLVETALRFLMATVAYGAAGLLVREIFQNRQRMLEHYVQLRLETTLRRKAEQQLRIMADDSPAGMLTIDSQARVVGANRAAHEMFGFREDRSMIGADVSRLLPAFASALRVSESRHLRSSAAGWATKVTGVQFPVMTWFSTYGSGQDLCLAAVIVDTSEEVRERERENLEHLRDYNRILAGTVSHEIRNMCSAISVVSSNLKRLPELQSSEDFRALQSLVKGLSEIASFELQRQRLPGETAVLQQILDQLRVVIEPDWADLDAEVVWAIEINPSVEVQGSPHARLQTLLNLTQNSLRAVEDVERPRLEVRVWQASSRIIASFMDNGPGVESPQDLFHPFRPNADGTGLGLYISKALLKSYNGDLIHVPTESGCRFDAVLAPIVEEEGGMGFHERIRADSLVHLG